MRYKQAKRTEEDEREEWKEIAAFVAALQLVGALLGNWVDGRLHSLSQPWLIGAHWRPPSESALPAHARGFGDLGASVARVHASAWCGSRLSSGRVRLRPSQTSRNLSSRELSGSMPSRLLTASRY